MFSLLSSEAKLQFKHWTVGIAYCLAMLFGWFLINNQTADNDIQISGSYFIITSFAIMILFTPVIVAIFSVRALIRDFDSGMLEIIYATGIKHYHFIISRWLVLVAICGGTFVSFSAGIFCALLFNHSIILDSGFVLHTLVWVLLVLILPNLALLTTLFLIVALLKRKALHLYILATFLFLGYQFCLNLFGSPIMAQPSLVFPDWQPLFNLLDPFGLSAYFEQLAHWSIADKNTLLPTLSGKLLDNRLMILLGTVLLLGITIRLFRFILPPVKAPKTNSRKIALSRHIDAIFTWLQPSRSLTRTTALIPYLTQMELWLTFKSRTFIATGLFLSILVVSEIYAGYTSLESLGVSAIASTPITLNRYAFDLLPRFSMLFLLFFAAEICWRNQDCKFASLVDPSPVSNRQLFIGRLLALCLLIPVFISLAIICSVMMQWLYHGQIQWTVYAGLYIYIGLPLLCMLALYLFVHGMVKHKFIGLGVTFGCFILFQSSLTTQLGLEHGLWRFSAAPLATYSSITGWLPNQDGFWGYMAVWLPLAVLMLLCGFALYQRGKGLKLAHRLRLLPAQWGKTGITLAAFSTLTLFGAGANVLYKTYVQDHYQSSQARLHWKIDYEKHYQFLKQQPQLQPAKVTTHINLYPSARRMALQAEYRLENPHNQPISELYVTTPQTLHYSNMTLTGASLLSYDPEFGVYHFQFTQPVKPGESVTLAFNAEQQQNGYQPLAFDNILLPDFSFFRAIRYMPQFGFVEHYQVKNARIRAEYGLAPLLTRTLEQDIDDHQGDFSGDSDWAQMDTTISTELEQTAIAPGRLVKQWQQQDRRYFHYRTQGKIRHILYAVSTNMKKTATVHNGINIQIFAPASQQGYVERHLAAIQDTLNYAGTHFSPYSADTISLVATPNFLPMTGYAMPQLFFIGEDVGFAVDLDNRQAFDHLYRRTVHETSHQWWGHGLDGAKTEGETVLVETLAKYTEMVVLAQKYGEQQVKRLIEYEQQRYFSGRSAATEKELPLYRADDNYLIYSKGAAAMYALRQELGEAHINRVLQQLLTQYRYPQKPATTLDLIQLLKQGVNAPQQQLIDQWLTQIRVDDWTIDKVTAKATDNDQYQLELCADNLLDTDGQVPVRILSTGNHVPIPDLLFDLNNQQHCQQWRVNGKPLAVTLDPDLLTLDRDRNNNHRQIEIMD